MSGRYCGKISGREVAVSGDYVLITFHSDSSVQGRGFSFLLRNISFGRYEIGNLYCDKVYTVVNQLCHLLSVCFSRIESF